MPKPLALSKANGIILISGIANIVPPVLAIDLVNSVANGKGKSISCGKFNGKSNGRANGGTASTFPLLANDYNDGNLKQFGGILFFGGNLNTSCFVTFEGVLQ